MAFVQVRHACDRLCYETGGRSTETALQDKIKSLTILSFDFSLSILAKSQNALFPRIWRDKIFFRSFAAKLVTHSVFSSAKNVNHHVRRIASLLILHP